MKTPIERLFDDVAWEVLPPVDKTEGLCATHSGVLVIGDVKIPCFMLNDGRAVIEESALEQLFPGWKIIFEKMEQTIPPPTLFRK
jgi:hypothetical protein